MKALYVYLDDERKTPEGYVRTYTPKETIEILKTQQVEHLSLDHDLGDDENIGTGYDVLVWLEESVFSGEYYEKYGFNVPWIDIHSMNPVGKERMQKLAHRIMVHNCKNMGRALGED